MVNHGPGLIFSGLATYVDSMAAIRKLVFEEKKYTLEQIRDALLANFEGYEALRRDCLNAPKYGNDDNYVDQYALDITEWTEKSAVSTRCSTRPSATAPCLSPTTRPSAS